MQKRPYFKLYIFVLFLILSNTCSATITEYHLNAHFSKTDHNTTLSTQLYFFEDSSFAMQIIAMVADVGWSLELAKGKYMFRNDTIILVDGCSNAYFYLKRKNDSLQVLKSFRYMQKMYFTNRRYTESIVPEISKNQKCCDPHQCDITYTISPTGIYSSSKDHRGSYWFHFRSNKFEFYFGDLLFLSGTWDSEDDHLIHLHDSNIKVDFTIKVNNKNEIFLVNFLGVNHCKYYPVK